MAANGSDQHVSLDQQFYEDLVKIVVPMIFAGHIISLSIVGLAIFLILIPLFMILIPLFIIMIPVLFPASFIFWICSYLTGEHPIGADQLEEVRKKIVKAAVGFTYNWIWTNDSPVYLKATI